MGVHAVFAALQLLACVNAALIADLLPRMLASQHGFTWPDLPELMHHVHGPSPHRLDLLSFSYDTRNAHSLPGVLFTGLQVRSARAALEGSAPRPLLRDAVEACLPSRASPRLVPGDGSGLPRMGVDIGNSNREQFRERPREQGSQHCWREAAGLRDRTARAAAVAVVLMNAAFVFAPMLARVPETWRRAYGGLWCGVVVGRQPLHVYLPPAMLLHVGSCCECWTVLPSAPPGFGTLLEPHVCA